MGKNSPLNNTIIFDYFIGTWQVITLVSGNP